MLLFLVLLFLSPVASASPVPDHSNCDVVPWGFLGSQRRVLCDGPMQENGWVRRRLEFVPEHYAPATTNCYSSTFNSYCYSYPGGWIDTKITDDETYWVSPDTVLPDEPGHLG